MSDRSISPAVEKLVDLTEKRYVLPVVGIRFGLDAIIGLIPVLGDFLGMLIGSVVVIEAVRLRAGLPVIGRMLFNLWLDGFLGSIPVAGDLWDLWFKANARNLALLRKSV